MTQGEKQESEEFSLDQQHSVEIAVNAKRAYSGKVKCYGVTPDDAWMAAIKQVAKLDALIAENNKGKERKEDE